ncbi:MAG: RNA-binding protein [Taibaiella sp.]|nr:RNA-binding protein [Taibaiella sp.]
MKIYVGNMSYETTEASLFKTFSKHGTVLNTRVMTDKFTGRTRGFGFVEMENDQEGLKAIEQLNDTMLDERNIIVNEARPRVENSDGDRNSGYNKRNNNRY